MNALMTIEQGETESSLINPEAEYQLLCTLLRDRPTLESAADIIAPEDFSHPFMARLYSLLVHEVSLGRTPNAFTLRPILERDPDYDAFGGWATMVEMSGSTLALLYDWRHMATELGRLARRRRMVAALIEAAEMAKDVTNTEEALVDAADAALSKAAETSETIMVASAAQCADEYVASLNSPREPGITSRRVTPLDQAIGDIRRGHLVIGAGRPGMGKTATAISYAIGAARAGHGVLIISLEMGREEITERAISDLCYDRVSKVPYEHIRDRKLDTFQRREVVMAADQLKELPLQIYDASGLTIPKLDRIIRRTKRRFAAKGHTLDLVIVDYLQLMGSADRNAKRYEIVTEVSGGLKRLAKAHQVGMFALAQLNRDVEKRPDKKPTLADLKESGSIEQDADVVVFFFRLEYYLRLAEPSSSASDTERANWEDSVAACQGSIDFICAKRRHGSISTRHGSFHSQYQAVR